MRALRRRLPELARSERGISIPELLVGTMVCLIVAGAAMTVLTTVIRTQPDSTDRSANVQEARTMIERLTRELRQAESVSTATATNLEMITLVDSASCGGAAATTAIVCRVAYACSGSVCTRSERNADGTGTPASAQIVRGLRSPSVFTYTPAAAPTYVGVTLEMADDEGGETITLRDGAAPRNWFDPGGGPA